MTKYIPISRYSGLDPKLELVSVVALKATTYAKGDSIFCCLKYIRQKLSYFKMIWNFKNVHVPHQNQPVTFWSFLRGKKNMERPLYRANLLGDSLGIWTTYVITTLLGSDEELECGYPTSHLCMYHNYWATNYSILGVSLTLIRNSNLDLKKSSPISFIIKYISTKCFNVDESIVSLNNCFIGTFPTGSSFKQHAWTVEFILQTKLLMILRPHPHERGPPVCDITDPSVAPHTAHVSVPCAATLQRMEFSWPWEILGS